MEIIPKLNTFIDLRTRSTRVPVAGQERVENLAPALLYEKLFKDRSDSFLFESGKGPEATARYSIMGASHEGSVTLLNSTVTVSKNGTKETESDNLLSGFSALNFEEATLDVEYLPHFWGGWVGFLGYEIAGLLENLSILKKPNHLTPDMYFIKVERLVVYDHRLKQLKYIVSPNTKGPSEDLYKKTAEEIKNFWRSIRSALNEISLNPVTLKNKELASNKNGNVDGPSPHLKSDITRSQYMNIVNQAKKYIEEGDIYQANLSQRFEIECKVDPFELYMKLRYINPSPFAGFLKFKDLVIISSSPERLLKLENKVLETRPIAGTRPRGKNEMEDEFLARELLLNEKEKAEHLMLVDLERNDLGRVCEYGSVKVTDLMFLEKYSHVTHIVSNIKGTLKPDVTVLEILRALFPGGTITGCPKIRCMEIINQLETSSRGPYSGSFGYIGFSRRMDFNIIIRTILMKGNKAWFHVGAGIVADSIPEKEYQETLDKAAAMIKVLTPENN